MNGRSRVMAAVGFAWVVSWLGACSSGATASNGLDGFAPDGADVAVEGLDAATKTDVPADRDAALAADEARAPDEASGSEVAEPGAPEVAVEPASDGEEVRAEALPETVDVPADDVPGDDASPGPSDPAEAGGFTWTEASEDLQLPGGLFGTTIPLTIVTPDAPGPSPVVVFTHGYQLGPSNYRTLAEHLASWGYVVILPQMPGGLTTHKTLKEHLLAILDWIDAQSSAADGVLHGRADPTRLGLSGHSMGGKISLLVASEDPRPRAAFLLDPVDAAGMPVVLNPADYPSVTPELMPFITIPLGFAGETTDAACSGFLCQACAPAEDNFQQYYLFAQSPALEITVNGAGHMTFLDDPDCGLVCSVCNTPSDDPATTRRLSRRYLTAFYNVWLKGDATFKDYLTGTAMQADVDAGLVSWQAKHGF